ncbi:MAG: hypothetical protein AB1351_12075 [Thermoproteota archaeon]
MADSEDATYNKISEDDSENFASGYRNIDVDGDNYRVKFLQFGVESPSGPTSGWEVLQYDMHYIRPGVGTVDLEDVVARSMEWGDITHGTYINYVDLGTAVVFQEVGKAAYTANADYPLKPGSSLSDG